MGTSKEMWGHHGDLGTSRERCGGDSDLEKPRRAVSIEQQVEPKQFEA